MSPATAVLYVIVLHAGAISAAAQDSLGPGAGRVFTLRQVSWWAADGLPAADVVARDTTFVLRFDTAWDWPASGMVPAAFDLEPGTGLRFTMVVRAEAIEDVLVSAEEARCDDSYAESPSGGLAALAFALVIPVDSSGEGETERALPVLRYGVCDDTVHTEFTREVTLYRPDSTAGRAAFLSLDGLVTSIRRIERELTPGGTVARATLRGHLSGRVRVTPTGVPDSIDLTGRLRGVIAYQNPWGTADTVYGTWVVELTGGWGEDPRRRAERLFAYFVEHGRYPDGDTGLDSATGPYAHIVERAQSDVSAIDSLVALRVAASTPKTRTEVEAALKEARPELPGDWAGRLLAEPTRITPTELLRAIRYHAPGNDSAYGVDVARFLARELAPLVIQRRRLLDREEFGAGVLDVLGSGRGFVRAAGPTLEGAARRANDPMSRDLLWFAAYQADPARYRRTLEAAVDSARGYGPIARAWVAGNGVLTRHSWGIDDEGELDSLVEFPGVDAAPEFLKLYLDRGASPAGHRLAPLWMRFVSEGRDLGNELRERFATDTGFRKREAVARYLEELGDTTARPWLREVLQGPADLRELAYELLPRDPVTDTTLIADAQRLLLGYIVGREALQDTAGHEVREPWVHDERPDLRILASDGLLASAIEPWRRLYTVMPMDSVRARVAVDGMQMAWVMSTLKRLGDRFYVSVSLVPVGASCLCGGGVMFVLERRSQGWVAVEASHWIS
jgi:hypothetical protein